MAMCTPSRAALLTGKYPIRTGMQHYVLREAEPRGLSLNETLLPQIMSKAGYESHMVGKWHLGFYKKEQTPTFRGFKSHYGFWQGYHNYFTHFVTATEPSYKGYDMRRNLEVDWSSYGKYTTDLFTEEAVKIISNHNKRSPLFLYLAHLAPHAGKYFLPCQAPQELIDKFAHIEDPDRRALAAMMTKLDESVGEVVSALKSRKMLDNSVIVFMGDNGAPTIGSLRNQGSNFPLRGIKATAWEGAHRGVTAIWSPLIKKPNRVSNQLMHITDWLPTMSSLAGLKIKDLGEIDGVDMWRAISKGGPSPRKDLLYNIDDVDSAYAAYRFGNWKYVTGYHSKSQNYNGWYGNVTSTQLLDPMLVLQSKTNLAISNTIIQKSFKNLFKNATRIDGLVNRGKMMKMRKRAKIVCDAEDIPCNPSKAPCLFNIEEDPCERANLAETNQDIVMALEKSLNRYRKSMVNALNVGSDCRANPSLWNDTWTYWVTEIDQQPQKKFSC